MPRYLYALWALRLSVCRFGSKTYETDEILGCFSQEHHEPYFEQPGFLPIRFDHLRSLTRKQMSIGATTSAAKCVLLLSVLPCLLRLYEK